MAQTINNEGSGISIVLGILLAVIIAVGAYFFFKQEGPMPDSQMTNTATEAPRVAPSAGNSNNNDTETPTVAP